MFKDSAKGHATHRLLRHLARRAHGYGSSWTAWLQCGPAAPSARLPGLWQANAFDGNAAITRWVCATRLVFPEIDYTRVDKIKGMNITLTTTARSDEERARELLKMIGVPLRS